MDRFLLQTSRSMRLSSILMAVSLLLSLSLPASDEIEPLKGRCEALLSGPSPMQGLTLLRGKMAGGFRSKDKVTIQKLKQLVDASNSIEELLGLLSPGIRRDFVLANNSLSSQFGDTTNPRVILSNSDSTFMMTFSGNENERGYDVAEVTIFNNSKKEFIPFEINFNSEKKLHRNPKKCSHCHGEKWRPIWDSYPFWPRTYGSISGTFLPKHYPLNTDPGMKKILQKESKLFQRFRAQRNVGRYRMLIGSTELYELKKSNSALTVNLAVLRASQISESLYELQQENSKIFSVLNKIFFHLGDNRAAPIDLSELLSGKALKQYKTQIKGVRSHVRKLMIRMRVRKIQNHFDILGIKPLVEDSLFDKDRIGISDFDFEFMTHGYVSHDDNKRHIQNSVENYSALYFVWVQLLGRTLTELNMSLIPDELPTLATPLVNGWRYINFPADF